MVRGIAAIVLIGLCICGCAATPGHISVNKSQFDGAEEMTMTPAWVCRENAFMDCGIRLGLYWRSSMPKDRLLLVVMVPGARVIEQGQSLMFNIDGEIVGFRGVDEFTEVSTTPGVYQQGAIIKHTYVPGNYIPPSNWSSKRYEIDRAFLERILNAQRVAVRVNMITNYAEGIFSQDKATTARPPFREFYEGLKNRGI